MFYFHMLCVINKSCIVPRRPSKLTFVVMFCSIENVDFYEKQCRVLVFFESKESLSDIVESNKKTRTCKH